ncbi:MAG: hypothetical protein NC243_12915, partial [Lachnoclostridium sp.]|nr:hypothetical protein [Lachnoclostridium sp.]
LAWESWMDAWLKCHMAEILPLGYVSYAVSCSLPKASKSQRRAMVDAAAEEHAIKSREAYCLTVSLFGAERKKQMLKVENKSKEEIAEIGRKIGEAFAAEKAGIVTMLTEEQAIKAFEIITECYYRSEVLYTTSETGEGYLAYGDKQTKLAVGPTLHMVKRFLCELPLKVSLDVARSGGEQYAKIFKKERNYIAVSMVVVLREFQGKGFMHKVLEQPFAEAKEKNIPCVLDTDTPVKVQKYIHCGMKLVGEKKLRQGISLYVMAYNALPEGGRCP